MTIFVFFAATPSLPVATTTNEMRIRKKSQNLNRSDSTGSSSGRKFLAPTLSDPQTLRTDKYQKKKATLPSGSGVTTPTGTRPRNQVLQPEHAIRSRPQVLRPELTTESEEYDDSIPSTSNAAIAGPSSKHTLPPLPSDASNLHYHTSTSPSILGFDIQSSSQFDIGGRSSNLNNNNNSSSTGSNVAASTSKPTTNLVGLSSSNTNIVYEVHDWWSDQVNIQSSDDDDDA